jgi:hypothetical protein
MEMFGVGDGTIRVEHVEATSRLMSWTLYVEKGWVLDNMKNMNLLCFLMEQGDHSSNVVRIEEKKMNVGRFGQEK